MHKSSIAAAACLVAIIACGAGVPAEPEERPAAVSGRFYPSDPGRLEASVRGYLGDALPPPKERPVALVLPHAGHVFSGQIAADGYRQAMEHEYDLIVILGTNHTTAPFNGVSVHTGSGYRTPLGLAEIDREIALALAAKHQSFAFRPAVHKREHSIEVQVPFVQVAFPGTRIVTAVVGRPDAALCARFGKALADVLGDRRALIIASSDLSHYPKYEDAVAADHAVLAAMARLDPPLLSSTIAEQERSGRPGLDTCACGEAPALAAMEAAKALGAKRGAVISYANSGDTSIGERGRVVGYGAVAFIGAKGAPDTAALRLPEAGQLDAEIGQADRKALLKFARSTIERYLTSDSLPLARGFSPVLWREQAVFVTLKKKGELRGCIGQLIADRPLCQAVGYKAFQAAFQDRRFQPVRAEELPDIDIEISLLTPPKRIAGVDEIKLGRDGVTMFKDGRGATYLPEVAVEQGWDRDEMLVHLCRKAGLPPSCWKSGAEFHTFQSTIFHESEVH
jgi:AmmeMemoRadiSam system protein B/AmmeMemoRadiSam system protein A